MPRFAGVLLVDPRGWVLLQERDEHPAIDPDRWGAPGGHVEDDETFLAAARRELREETGVDVEDGELRLAAAFDSVDAAGVALGPMQVFAAATDLTDADVTCHEGRRIVFVAPHDALALDLTGSASIFLSAFLTSDLHEELTRR